MKFVFLVAVLALALVATLVANWTLRSDIERCGELAEAEQRLICFDHLSTELGTQEDHDKVGR